MRFWGLGELGFKGCRMARVRMLVYRFVRVWWFRALGLRVYGFGADFSVLFRFTGVRGLVF